MPSGSQSELHVLYKMNKNIFPSGNRSAPSAPPHSSFAYAVANELPCGHRGAHRKRCVLNEMNDKDKKWQIQRIPNSRKN